MFSWIKTKKGFLIFTLGIGLFLFLATTWKSGPAAILGIISAFTLWDFIVIVTIFLIQYLLSTLSIGHILKKLHHPISARRLFPLELMRASVSYVTPFSNNGGEPLVIYLLKKKYHIPYSRSSAAIMLEIILKLAVSLLFIALSCVYFFFTTASPIFKTIFFAFFLLLCFGILSFFYCVIKKRGFLDFLGHYFGLKKIKFFQKNQKIIHNTDRLLIHFIHHHPKDFALSSILAFLSIGCYLARFYLIILFLGYAPNLIELILVFSLTQALLIIPIPTLLGIHELGQSFLSLITQMPLQTGISFVIILRVITLMMTIPGFILLGHQSINGFGKRLKDKIFFNLNNYKMRRK